MGRSSSVAGPTVWHTSLKPFSMLKSRRPYQEPVQHATDVAQYRLDTPQHHDQNNKGDVEISSTEMPCRQTNAMMDGMCSSEPEA